LVVGCWLLVVGCWLLVVDTLSQLRICLLQPFKVSSIKACYLFIKLFNFFGVFSTFGFSKV